MSRQVRQLSAEPSRTVQRECTACASKQSDKPCPTCGGSLVPKRESLLEPVQAKLRIGPANDAYEQEADRVADTIVSSATPAANIAPAGEALQGKRTLQAKPLVNVANFIQRQVAEDGEVDFDEDDEPDESLQMDRGSNAVPEVSTAQEARVTALRGGGQPLSDTHRSFFESRFGYDFSGVRIHNDAGAAQSAGELGARAYTVGQDVVFGAGEFQPGTPSGMHLMAHELTHVVQQQGGSDGGLQRDVLPRCATPPLQPDSAALKYVEVILDQDLVLVEFLNGKRFSGKLKRPDSNIGAGTYKGVHVRGQDRDCIEDAPNLSWFITRVPPPWPSWASIPGSGYVLTVRGTSAAFEAEADPSDIGKKAKKGKVTGEGEGKGVGKEGSGTGTGKGSGGPQDQGKKAGKGSGSGAGDKKKADDKKSGGGQKSGGGTQKGGAPSTEDAQILSDFQKELGEAGSEEKLPPDPAVAAALKELTAAERADLARYLRDAKKKADEEGKVFDIKKVIEFYKNLSAADRELLRTNLELTKPGSGATELPKHVTIALDLGAQATATKMTESVNQLNGSLGNIQAKVKNPDDKKKFDPIDLNKLPVFTEMMMLQGLLAGAAQKSPQIEEIAKDLMESIGGIRDYVLEEIAWLAAELAASSIISALLAVGTAGGSLLAESAEAAWVLKRLNDLREFLQKVEKVYSTIQKIREVINKVVGIYETYKKVRAQYEKWSTRLEKLYSMLEKASAGDDIEEQIDKLEDEILEELQKSLDDPNGLGGLLETFFIPEDVDEDGLREILFNIPRGIEAMREVVQFYSGMDRKNLEHVKILSYKSVRAGALLYPFVGYLASFVSQQLHRLMPPKDLSDRLFGILSRVDKQSSKWKVPNPRQTRAKLKTVKKSKDRPKKKDLDPKAKDKKKDAKKDKDARKEKDAKKDKDKKDTSKDDDPKASKKKDDKDDPKKKKSDADKKDKKDDDDKKKKDEGDKKKDDDAKKKADEDPKKKAAREKKEQEDSEWQLVLQKVSRLKGQFAGTGLSKEELLREARQITKAHKTVCGAPKIDVVPKKGYWSLRIPRKGVAGVRAENEVLMNDRIRLQKGRRAVEAAVNDLKDNELDQASVSSKVSWIQSAYEFKSLRVGNRNDGRAGIAVFGAMGKGPEIVLATLDDLTGLATGELNDPIPISWYKEEGNYAKSISLMLNGRTHDACGIYESHTLLKWRTGLDVDVRVGIDPQFMVKPGKKLHRKSTPRLGKTQENYRKALKSLGFDWRGYDADHVLDLGFEGPDDFINLWPLERRRNQWAFTGKWYFQYRVEYRDPKTPREARVGSLFALRDKYFTVTKNTQTIPKLGGRWDTKKKP
jgi:hypothetical protein